MNEKILKMCVVALIEPTYFTNLPWAKFFREIRMTNFVSVAQK